MSKLTFNRSYFTLALLIFAVEVLIALFVHDHFVRPYLGDFLVVILLYCFLKAFLNVSVLKAAIAVLLLSFIVEALQFFRIVEVLGLERSAVARTVIGTSFSWGDVLIYIAGISIVLLVEKYVLKKDLKAVSKTRSV